MKRELWNERAPRMTDWTQVLVRPDCTVRQAVAVIDSAGLQIALVVDGDRRLLGTVTDGDIRRGILAGCSLEQPVADVMNDRPMRVGPGDAETTTLVLMQQHRIQQMPVVDLAGRVVGLETLDRLLRPQRRDNPVVLMAGGLGTRLAPLTDACPKPMLAVGNRPILETILCNFIEHGFHKFYISVNYRAEQIKAHFGDGSKWGVTIEYLQERERLGTAGALTLLPETPELPVFVMNGDILAKVNFGAMLDFHVRHGSAATLGVRQFSHTIPYGVVTVADHRLVNIVEKPQQQVFVSAGIYLLAPETLAHIPRGEFFDMPTLYQRLIDAGAPTAGFPVHEYWIDIGRIEDFERARKEYTEVFE